MASSGASIGAMRKSVVIQSVASTTDSGGGEKGLYVFTMRYVTGITNSHRISYNSKLFNITSVINLDERNKYMVIKAMEGVAV